MFTLPAPPPDDFSRAPEAALFARLATLGVSVVTERHAPMRTVAESRLVKTDIPGAHTKNLFLRDKSGALVLASVRAEAAAPLNQLHRLIGCQRLSFGDPELMWRWLGVTPGSVTAFALINAPPGSGAFVLDRGLLAFDRINFHPLRNDMTTGIARDDFLMFLNAIGHPPVIWDFDGSGG
jgi:Ala-tRNA(Pro) deacylase